MIYVYNQRVKDVWYGAAVQDREVLATNFSFEEDLIITDDGWTFTMEKVKDYTLDGIVLALKKYTRDEWPYDPCNVFCPIDLLIGIDDVKENPENYDYSITSFNILVILIFKSNYNKKEKN